MKNHDIVSMLRSIKQIFIVLVLLLLAFGGSFSAKCISMNNQPCTVIPTFIDLNPDELQDYSFIISLEKCEGNCNIAEDPFGRIWYPRKYKM